MAKERRNDRLEELETEVFERLRKTEESALETLRRLARAMDEAVPLELPVAREVAEDAFDFVEAVLKAQREFAHSVVEATRARAGRAPAKRTRTTTARKTAHPRQAAAKARVRSQRAARKVA